MPYTMGMTVQNATPPISPSKEVKDINTKIELIVMDLNKEWSLGLEIPDPQESPKKRAENKTPQTICFDKIKYLSYKKAIDTPYLQFKAQAEDIYTGWMKKPKADRELLPPKTRHIIKPITSKERDELLELFIKITNPVMQRIKERDMNAARTPKRSFADTPAKPVNDRPLPLDYKKVSKPLSRPKRRSSEETDGSTKSLKRPKSSPDYPENDEINPFKKPPLPQSREDFEIFSRKPSDSSLPSEIGRERPQPSRPQRRNTDASLASSFSSVFDRSGADTLPPTQETVPDQGEEPEVEADTQSSEVYGSSFDPSTLEELVELDNIVQTDIVNQNDNSFSASKPQSSGPLPKSTNTSNSSKPEHCGSISKDAISFNTSKLGNDRGGPSKDTNPFNPSKTNNNSSPPSNQEKELRDRLIGVFPDSKDIPACFFRTPFHVQYEILRVFLYTGVSLSELKLPLRRDTPWDDHSNLWNYLRKLEAMQGKVFPETTGREAWEAANNDFRHGHRGVTMTGTLRYNTASAGPLFKFQLEPLKLDKTHRLSRRFGCDRFMEIDIPSLNGRRTPKIIQDLGPRAKTVIIEWLGNAHELMSRMWVRFCSKPKERKQRQEPKVDSSGRPLSQPEVDSDPQYRIFFFAIDGDGFRKGEGTPELTETIKTGRASWSIKQLLNWIRPTWENKHQPTHKLNARTALAVSRNTATVVVERGKIRYKKDIENEYGEVVTDGAGRISQALAMRIAKDLGLSHLPSGFQGRFGDAKGFWSVDPRDRSIDEWIEIYDSQRKWVRKGTLDDKDFSDPSHRTFEVNKFSGKLKPAELNQQLMPILMDRAKSKAQMQNTLKKLLEDCLRDEVDKERVAMNNPQAFRKWVRDSTSIADRVKYDSVQFLGAIPDARDERMNMLLDAGFEPLKNFYLKELARVAYEDKCNDLKKRMKVTIMKSTYAYMVPDWTGSLKEGEIFMHSSEPFSDDGLDLFSGLPLSGCDVLVARMPAHFSSDIQRVKAVVTPELLGLRDVIVFPTKGECLASKLSGGDYDGDLAWVCWEASIVENFVNAPVPNTPDLVKEGYITKDTITYEELVKGEKDPTEVFLNYSMEFSLEQNMVGICTDYKEKWCYTYGTITSKEAIWLSKLLSDLVDQAKSGYSFTEKQFDEFKKKAIKKTEVKSPLYKFDHTDARSKNIIDQLKRLAEVTIKTILTEFASWIDGLPMKISPWDNDLIQVYKWADNEATTKDSEWLGIMIKLQKDITSIKELWAEKTAGQRSRLMDESKPGFSAIVADIYHHFQQIIPEGSGFPEGVNVQPVGKTPLTRLLLQGPRPEFTQWALLRASFLFKTYSINHVSSFVWYMAGIQLCHMKAARCGVTVAVTPHMYSMLKPDATFVKLRLSENEYQWDARVIEGEGNVGDDDD